MLKKLMALSVIFMFVPFALGQQTNIGKELTLQDCINIALQLNTTVLQAQYQSESQSARVLNAYGSLLPSINAQGQFTYSSRQSPAGYVVVGGTSIPVSNSSITRTYQAGISADLTLFNGTANYAGINAANSQSQAASLSFERARQTAVYQTIQYYLSVFNARDQLKISEDNLKRDQRQLESIKESNTVGSASLADVYQQQATVSGDEYQLVQAKNAYDQAQATIKYFLGIPVVDSVSFVDAGISSEVDTTSFSQLNEEYRQVDQLVRRALQSRPDYEAAIQTVNASKSNLTIAKAAYSPTLTASGSYGINGPDPNMIDQNKGLFGQLVLSLPIFNQFQTQTNIEVADVNLKSAEQTLDATKRQVQLDVYQALLNLYSSEKGYESAVNAVVYAKINLETAQEKYKIGSGTLLDVLTANAIYTQALSNQVVAAYTFIQAKKQVEYASGTIKY